MLEILNPDKLESEAEQAYLSGDYPKAADNYNASRIGFQAQGDLIKMAEMANNCSVARLKEGDPETALRVLEGVDLIFEQEGDIKGLAITLGNRGAALDALNRRDESAIDYKKSADLFRRCGESELYAVTMQSLSALQLRNGKAIEALVSLQHGINQIKKPRFSHRLIKKLLDIPFRLSNR
jgi:tetratricopeptide (TPR) repeat protein